jgi:murein DD-endopeptidase MepM/ murein hydrolase activator NlpD
MASLTESIVGESINTECAGLYIDGELIGATTDVNGLKKALDNILEFYRKDFDDKTTTEFANDVEVLGGAFGENDFMSVDDIISAAGGKLSISLSTDIKYTREIAYETTTEYDESEDSSYEEVKTEGKSGEEEVVIRATYVDGVQTDAVETGTKVIKEAVDEVIVKGKGNSSTASASSSGSFIWPMPYTHTLSSTFGERWGRLHGGIDISDSGIYGQEIIAADSGTVTFAGGDPSTGYGYYVMIDHGNGYTTLYGHCSSLAVSAGQTVAQGQTVGYVGSTGNSTGPHLHFEIRVNDVQTDPLGYVS